MKKYGCKNSLRGNCRYNNITPAIHQSVCANIWLLIAQEEYVVSTLERRKARLAILAGVPVCRRLSSGQDRVVWFCVNVDPPANFVMTAGTSIFQKGSSEYLVLGVNDDTLDAIVLEYLIKTNVGCRGHQMRISH